MDRVHANRSNFGSGAYVDVKRALGLTVAITAVLASGACASQETPAPPANVAHYTREGPGGDAALLPGRLELIDDCVYVVDETTGDRTVPVFADDLNVRWENDELRVGSSSFPLDETLELGGGEAGLGADVSVPEGCDPGARMFIVNM